MNLLEDLFGPGRSSPYPEPEPTSSVGFDGGMPFGNGGAILLAALWGRTLTPVGVITRFESDDERDLFVSPPRVYRLSGIPDEAEHRFVAMAEVYTLHHTEEAPDTVWRLLFADPVEGGFDFHDCPTGRDLSGWWADDRDLLLRLFGLSEEQAAG